MDKHNDTVRSVPKFRARNPYVNAGNFFRMHWFCPTFWCRLQREALKQTATDPKTGIIDVSILTTGVSSSERQRRQTMAKELQKLLQSRARSTGGQIKSDVLYELSKEQSQVVSGSQKRAERNPSLRNLFAISLAHPPATF